MSDAFEDFNTNMGMGRIQDPYGLFRELRDEAPIQPIDLRRTFDIEAADIGDDAPPIYTACTYDAVLEVLKDGKRFSSQLYAGFMGLVMGHTILEMDEPEHHRYRSLLMERAMRGSKELGDYLRQRVENRRAYLGDDFVSVLIRAELDGHSLTDDEIIAFLRLLLPAGAETTYRSSRQPAPRAAEEPRPARRAAQGPVPHPAGHRRGAAVGAAAAHDHSGSTWPAWRRGLCSRRFSTACRTSASTPKRRRRHQRHDLPRPLRLPVVFG